jgi:hypothetical protein
MDFMVLFVLDLKHTEFSNTLQRDCVLVLASMAGLFSYHRLRLPWRHSALIFFTEG